MLHVLMLSLVFAPDTVSTANMMTDIAQGLSAKGHIVTVLTSMPHYNPSVKVLGNPVYRSPITKIYTEVEENGVRVLRVFMPLKRQRVWRRALDFLWFHIVTVLVALFKVSRQDIVFVTSPPITLGLSGYVLSKLLRAKLVYDVRELWPDVPVRMGLFRNRSLIWLVYKVESFVYQRSAAITLIAHSFINTLICNGTPKDKLHFTPNFVDVEWLTPRPKMNGFAVEHNLQEKFVVFYAGNIGLTQGLEILIDIARIVPKGKNIVIVIVGEGAGRPKLEQAIQGSGLENMLFLPFLPYERIPETYATADVCVSPMRFGFSYDTVPSKIYTAMAAGRPVICASEPDTESAELLCESKAGIVVPPESDVEMAKAILDLYHSPEKRYLMGQKGRQWIVEHYSKDAVIDTYNCVIVRVADTDKYKGP